MFPKPRRDEFGEQALVVENLFQLGAAPSSLLNIPVGWANVVVVKLNPVKAEILILAQLDRKRQIRANGRAEGIGACADVPGSECESIFLSHPQRLRRSLR